MAIDSVNSGAKESPTRIMQKASEFKRWGRGSPFVRYGIPLISLTVLGSFGLGHMIEGRSVISTYDPVYNLT